MILINSCFALELSFLKMILLGFQNLTQQLLSNELTEHLNRFLKVQRCAGSAIQ